MGQRRTRSGDRLGYEREVEDATYKRARRVIETRERGQGAVASSSTWAGPRTRPTAREKRDTAGPKKKRGGKLTFGPNLRRGIFPFFLFLF
jgi:hypothetical protein